MPKSTTAKTALGLDADTFDLKSWMAGTKLTTRSIEVCGKPHLMGEIQELAAQLDRPETRVVDERAAGMASDQANEQAIAERIEELREEMLASIVVWKFRGLSPDEMATVRESAPANTTGKAEEIDYRTWAAQLVSIDGRPVELDWTDMRNLHRGVTGEYAGLGDYFVQTIAATANAAHAGAGVTVPFSQRSSSLTRPQPRN